MPSWTDPPQAEEPTPGTRAFGDVLPWELKCVYDRRRRVWEANRPANAAPAPPAPPGTASDPTAAPTGGPAPPAAVAAAKTGGSSQQSGKKEELETHRRAALDMGLVGLALSGGGIRSASVALGFLQGLGRLRLLQVFDYLSTVSGGGYTGAWLAAWVRREHDRTGAPAGDRRGLANVELQLDPSRVSEAEATRYHMTAAGQDTAFREQVDQEPEPVYHVRAYSNYLTPRGGVFSADTWVLAAIYLRNTLVNLLIVLAAAAAVVALSRFAVWGYAQGVPTGEGQRWEIGRVLLTAGAVLPGLAAALLILWNRTVVGAGVSAVRVNPAGEERPAEYTAQGVRWLVVIPLVVAAVLATWCLSANPSGGGGLRFAGAEGVKGTFFPEPGADKRSAFFVEYPGLFYAAACALAAAVMGVLGAAFHWLAGAGKFWTTVASMTLFGALIGLFSFLALSFAIWQWTNCPALLATFGPPLILAACVLAGFAEQWVLFGLSPYEQEWRSRLAADLMIAAAAWLIFFGTTLYLPKAFKDANEWVVGAVVSGWAGTVLGGVFAARSRQADPAAAGPGRVGGLLAAIAPPVFLVGVLALLSVGLSAALRAVELREVMAPVGRQVGLGVGNAFWLPGPAVPLPDPDALDKVASFPRGDLGGGVWVGLAADHWRTLAVAAGVLAGFTLLLSFVADVNTFSMHALYGNRLVRCFLAASRRKGHENPDPEGRPRRGAPFGVRGAYRHANAYTGFDAGDDLPLCDLRPLAPGPGRTPAGCDSRYDGPYPLFNTTLNLIAGQDLALRDRKGASFVLTPDFCGSEATGYARTPDGKHKENLTVGRAMTISGAAADASMPLQSSALRALLALFNARLGWWMENPREYGRRWKAGSPKLGVLASLFREFFGLTHDRGEYVHLSDGGHFDNSGVYELVRRRCRFVVALDADVDPNDAPENLANMVRRVRTDFGVRIEIDTLPLRKDAAGQSKWHVAVGAIRYDEVDPDALAGTFVFVRASVSGDEPADLRNYAAKDRNFPHHSTVTEQFFDEGQFESYRALGDHIAESVFGDAAAGFDAGRLREMNHLREVRRFFGLVRNRWFPPPPNFGPNYLEAGKAFTELLHSLRADPKMNRLTHGMYPEVLRLAEAPPGDWVAHDVERAELTAVDHILEVMELVWVGMELDGHFSHPLHSGWMGSFRRWAAAPAFQKYWPVVRGEYSREFVRFCERVLNLPAVKVRPVQINALPAGAAWADMIGRLNEEYVAEWAGTLSEIEAFEAARERAHPGRRVPAPRDLYDVVGRALNEPDGKGGTREPLVWFLTLDNPPTAVDAGAVRAVATSAAVPAAPATPAPAAPPAVPVVPDLPVGILAVYPVPAAGRPDPGACYEVLFWLRGAYRSLGLGRQAIEAEMRAPEAGADVTHFLGVANRATGAGVTAERMCPRLHEYIRLRLVERLPEEGTGRLIARYPVTGRSAPDRVQRILWLNFFYDYEFRRAPGDRRDRYLTLQYPLTPGEKATVHAVMYDRAAHGE